MDRKRLLKALRDVRASEWQYAAAAILLSVNGLENALEFVYGLQPRGLLPWQHQARYEQLPLDLTGEA